MDEPDGLFRFLDFEIPCRLRHEGEECPNDAVWLMKLKTHGCPTPKGVLFVGLGPVIPICADHQEEVTDPGRAIATLCPRCGGEIIIRDWIKSFDLIKDFA